MIKEWIMESVEAMIMELRHSVTVRIMDPEDRKRVEKYFEEDWLAAILLQRVQGIMSGVLFRVERKLQLDVNDGMVRELKERGYLVGMSFVCMDVMKSVWRNLGWIEISAMGEWEKEWREWRKLRDEKRMESEKIGAAEGRRKGE